MISLTEWPPSLLEPLTFEFFRRALLASCLVRALCGLVGVYMVLRRGLYRPRALPRRVPGELSSVICCR